MGESKGIENLHLVTYDVPSGRYADHGAIFFADGQRPSYVNSIAVGKDGTVYALSRITQQEARRGTDLMSIPASLDSAIPSSGRGLPRNDRPGPGTHPQVRRQSMKNQLDRRRFLATTGGGRRRAGGDQSTPAADRDKPALLGGKPVRREPFPELAEVRPARREEPARRPAQRQVVSAAAASASTGSRRPTPSLTGAKHCVATANGTGALFTSLAAVGIEPGDEVIVPPYTFIATINAVLLQYALPIFVDTDPETFQIDAAQDRGGHHRPDRGDHAGAPRRQRGRPGRDPGDRREAQACRSSRMPARPTSPNGAARRSARWARPAASASRSPRTSRPAKEARS